LPTVTTRPSLTLVTVLPPPTPPALRAALPPPRTRQYTRRLSAADAPVCGGGCIAADDIVESTAVNDIDIQVAGRYFFFST